MNLELLESFGQNHPEEHDGNLDSSSVALTCAFNRRGTLLAVGCNDGRIVIWDFVTRGIAKMISAHSHTICSVGWSRNGRKLVSASSDFLVCVWDVLHGELEASFRFPGPVQSATFNPRNDKQVLVCPLKAAPFTVNVETGKRTALPCVEDNDVNLTASWDRRGNFIYAGNSRGKIFVINAIKNKLIKSFKVGTSNNAIKQIKFARKGEFFLVNSVDRVIRVYDGSEIVSLNDPVPESKPPLLSTIEPVQKVQDLVNRTLWKVCTFSGDGEYICAGSAKQHQIYIWERTATQQTILKILEGTRGEQLLDIVWHPVRPIICSVSSGVVSIWSKNQVENWSAFAPDFTELDENVEYSEHESEFDEEDEDKAKEPDKDAEQAEDVDIDVETVKRIDAFCSSDEESESADFLFLPITPEVDDPEQNPHLPPRDPTDAPGESSGIEANSDEKLKHGKRSKSLKKSAKRHKLR